MKVVPPKKDVPLPEPDMTPMIDMTFQLIAFFMVLLNFGEAEQDARIRLPSSQLAKPAETALDYPLVLQLTGDDQVILGGELLPLGALDERLRAEAKFMEYNGNKPSEATVIVRADARAKAGAVQELIQKCQTNGFENFALRAKQEDEG